MASIIKANELQDFNGNAIITSDGSGNVTVNSAAMKMTPYFFVRKSANQSVTSGVITKVTLDVEDLDTDSCFDNTTNYRFTPTTAGKYFVYANLQLQMNNYDIYVASISIYKNGSSYYTFNTASNTSTSISIYSCINKIFTSN